MLRRVGGGRQRRGGEQGDAGSSGQRERTRAHGGSLSVTESLLTRLATNVSLCMTASRPRGTTRRDPTAPSSRRRGRPLLRPAAGRSTARVDDHRRAAAPPTFSAAASQRPSGSRWTPVAAPISGFCRKAWPMASSSARSGLFHSAGSSSVVAWLRWLARGAAIASTSGRPRSRRPVSVCSTVVMMVAPPGEPTASTGRPCVEHDRRRDGRARALARARQIRVVDRRVRPGRRRSRSARC